MRLINLILDRLVPSNIPSPLDESPVSMALLGSIQPPKFKSLIAELFLNIPVRLLITGNCQALTPGSIIAVSLA